MQQSMSYKGDLTCQGGLSNNSQSIIEETLALHRQETNENIDVSGVKSHNDLSK